MELKDMTKQLIASGFSQKRLAEEIVSRGTKCSQPTIWRILNQDDFEASYSVGMAIHRIHTERISEAA